MIWLLHRIKNNFYLISKLTLHMCFTFLTYLPIPKYIGIHRVSANICNFVVGNNGNVYWKEAIHHHWIAVLCCSKAPGLPPPHIKSCQVLYLFFLLKSLPALNVMGFYVDIWSSNKSFTFHQHLPCRQGSLCSRYHEQFLDLILGWRIIELHLRDNK